DALVEALVGAGLRRHGRRPAADVQYAPGLLRLGAPARVAGPDPRHERVLLDVEAVLDVGGVLGEHATAWAQARRREAHPHVRAHAGGLGDRDEHSVFDPGRRAAGVDLGVDGGGRPEEHERLVDEVAPEVEQHAASLLGLGQLAPAAADIRPPALVA